MKKILLAGLFSLLVFPSFATAQVTPTADVDTVEQSSCINISNNMRYRMRDATVNNEVSDLQDFLNISGYLKSGPTGYFGLATFNAVKKFQSASGFAPTGYVGPLTRAKISALTCGGSVEIPAATQTSTPVAIYPQTQVAITPATPTTSASMPVGCTSTIGFSPLTGKRCLVPATPAPTVTPTNLPAGCVSTLGYSSVTGNACDGTQPPKPIYPSGCTSTYGWSSTTGNACDGSTRPNPVYPSGCTSNSGWSSTTGQSCGATSANPTVTVTSPNGGETFSASDSISVKYSVSNLPASTELTAYLYNPINGNIASNLTVGPVSGNGADSIYLALSKVANIPTGQYKITLCALSVSSPMVSFKPLCDSSDNYFSIAATTTTSPTVTSFTVIDSNKWIGSKEFSWTTSNVSSNNTDYVDFIIDCANGLTIKNVVSGVTFPCGVKKYMPEATGFVLEIKNTTNAPINITASVRAVGSPVSNPSSKIVYLTIPPATTTTAAPNILSISPSTATPDQTITIIGSNLNLSANKVVASGNTYDASFVRIGTGVISSTQLSTTPRVLGLTLAGVYPIKIGNSLTGDSNTVYLTVGMTTASVPTVEFIGTPTLSLQYDSAGKESMLVGKATIKVTAGSVPLDPGYIASILQFYRLGYGVASSNSMHFVTSNSLEKNKIPANTAVTFTIVNTIPTKELFAGAYSLSLSGFTYPDYRSDGTYTSYQTIQYTSFGGVSIAGGIGYVVAGVSSVTIIGETSPYIQSSYQPTSSSGAYLDELVVIGVRFSPTSNQVTMNGVTKLLPTGASDKGPLINIKISDFGITTTGVYQLQISTSAGASNKVNVKTVTVPTTASAYSITSIAGAQSSYATGAPISVQIKSVGGEGDGTPASSDKGYNVQAYIFPASDTNFSNYLAPNPAYSYNGTYNASTGYWNVQMTAPSAPGSYNLRMGLYCSRFGTTCYNAGGYGVESVRILPFTVTTQTIAAPTYSASPTEFVAGLTYDFTAKVTGAAPNTQVYFYVQRPDGTFKHNAQLIGSTDSTGYYSYTGAQTDSQIGTYPTWVVVGTVKSNVVNIVAKVATPTVEFIGTPTLSLQYSSLTGNEELVGKIAFKITAGSADVMFSNDINYPTIPYVAAFNGCCSGRWAINGPTSINAGATATYTGTLTAPTKVMFAGTYSISPSTLGYSVNGVWQNLDSSSFKNARSSNSVTIIGETSPYIQSSYQPTSSSGAYLDELVVIGVRFSPTSNQVTMNGVTKLLPTGASDKGPLINIKISDFGITTSGIYPLQISTSEGASNKVNVNVTVASATTTTTTNTSTACPQSVTINGTTYTLSPCNINMSMVDGQGNKTFSTTLVPTGGSSTSFGYSVRGYGVGFPTYGILGASSGGATGNTLLNFYFNDSYLSADGSNAKTYTGYLPVHIFQGSETGNDNNYLNLNINLTVNPATITAATAPSSQLASIIGAFTQTPAPTSTFEYEWIRNLEVNSPYADDVSALQAALKKEGVYAGDITGGFYTQTYLAVKAFQAKYGIESTGFVGPITRAKLNELYR